jgi:CDP-glycerol glycerophosphotransferase (TagB/SpsB family)
MRGSFGVEDFEMDESVNLNEFFDKIDILICGDSSIALEASLANVPVFVFNSKYVEVEDYYGFVRNHLVTRIPDLETFVPWVELGNTSKDVLKAYSASYGTEKQGREQEHAALIIKKFAESCNG